MSFRNEKKKRFPNGTYRSDEFWKSFRTYLFGSRVELTEEEKLKLEREKCCKKREIKSCKQCCRYENCYHNKPLYDDLAPLTYGERRLGLAIIASCIEDYKSAWRAGEKYRLRACEKWLLSPEVEILSAGEYDGVALLEGARRTCEKIYGKFDPIYQRKQKLIKSKITSVEKQLKSAKDEKEKKGLIIKLSALRGKLIA